MMALVKLITVAERVLSSSRDQLAFSEPGFAVFHQDFLPILGDNSSITLALEHTYPFAHEAGVYFPTTDTVFVTSNQFIPEGQSEKTIAINKLSREQDGSWTREEIDTAVTMANGGINYESGVLFCSQGDLNDTGGLVYMDSQPPYDTSVILNNYYGRRFNSINDVVIHSDGSIWFTDPIYGFEQGIRPTPQLPCQVYRFDPQTGEVRVVADGFGRPNGISFSPDEQTLYVTDTDWIHGDGTTDDMRASTIYAFDVIDRSGSKFLGNRRVFAMADTGVPDGIKCDTAGNVYAGCGDGISVWNAGGVLLGKILVPGGTANFCFGKKGELFLLNEKKFWVVKISSNTTGALLAGMGIEVD